MTSHPFRSQVCRRNLSVMPTGGGEGHNDRTSHLAVDADLEQPSTRSFFCEYCLECRSEQDLLRVRSTLGTMMIRPARDGLLDRLPKIAGVVADQHEVVVCRSAHDISVLPAGLADPATC